MKRAETLAWVALAGLLAIAAILLTGGILYNTTPFWSGALAATGQCIVVGLAGYGLRLAGQAQELADLPPGSSTSQPASTYRMNFGDDPVIASSPDAKNSVKTIDTGFQRLLVIISAIVLITLSAVIFFTLLRPTLNWASANPDKPFPLAGAFDKPIALDELALVIGLGAAAMYAILYWITRVTRATIGYGEAVNSTFTLGITGFIAIGVATLLGYLRVAYAAEIAGGIMAALMLLQGLELFVNSLRSYSGIDEADQEAVDLQALPLIPMLSSFWLNGLKLLFAQSFGLTSSTGERGVISRMMPRAIAAIIILAVLASSLHVVRPGEVAVLERLGYAEMTKGDDGKMTLVPGALLQPGLHITMPWPLDELVRIPTGTLKDAHVGIELHELAGGELPFQFWTAGPEPTTEQQVSTQFITGDVGSPQMIETYVAILWRVGDPAKFYNHLSHSDFYAKSEEGGTHALPVYDELVQQCASFAVTRTIGIHNLDDIMLKNRIEVEQHCRQILQAKLDEVDSGIVIQDLSIKDLHPPRGHDVADVAAPDGRRLGPASQFEDVVTRREIMEAQIDVAEGDQIRTTELAKGTAASTISQAQGYQYDRIGTAQAEAAQVNTMMEGRTSLSSDDNTFIEKLAKMQTKYRSMKDALAPVNKVVVDPKVKDVQLYQTGANPFAPRPPGE